MQLSTAIKMAQTIEARGQSTTRELADEFGLSVRTVLRYITELSLCYPIYTKPGAGGGICWLKTNKKENKNMANLNNEINIKVQATGRPCWVSHNSAEGLKKAKAFLHSIATRSYVVEPSPLKGGHPGGQVSRTFAIVENEHGYLVEVELERVQLLDTAEQLKENAEAWEPKA